MRRELISSLFRLFNLKKMLQRYKSYFFLFLVIILIVVFLFFLLKDNKIKNTFSGRNVSNKILSNEDYNAYFIKVWNLKPFEIKVGSSFEKCFDNVINSGYKLVSNDFIETRIMVPRGLFDCIKSKDILQQYYQKKWDYIIDQNWILHILNSNVSLRIKWYKIYWQ